MTVALQPVTDGVHARLDAALSVPVHIGDREGDVPAVVVIPIPGGEFLRTLSNGWDDVRVPYQITTVARSHGEAEHLADLVRDALTTTFPAGVKHVDPEGAPGARIDRDVDPDVWVSTPVFYLTV